MWKKVSLFQTHQGPSKHFTLASPAEKKRTEIKDEDDDRTQRIEIKTVAKQKRNI
jgi:hypothetical protein